MNTNSHLSELCGHGECVLYVFVVLKVNKGSKNSKEFLKPIILGCLMFVAEVILCITLVPNQLRRSNSDS